MKLSIIRARLPVAAVVVALIGGCATKRIVTQWSNPNYAGPAQAFKRILVIAATDQTALRRNFEDAMVARLKAAGVDAVPSYRYFPENGKVPEPRLKEAVQKSGADAAMITRLIGVTRRTEVTPGYYDPFPAFGLYGWYASAWYGGFYVPPRVYRYPVFFSETTLYDVVKDEVVWTGTIRTVDPEEIDEAIDDYASTVVAALQEKNLLRG
ncbi:MAG TPA: hypothetical protein VNO43_14775 [Candidatus Eisenbacteria bacterium]|nr:hypothetical protein [Candidatus Eisenbacteria bacterium]